MPLKLVRNDITKMDVDAIVNAANESLLGGGGVDGCIHRAAGPDLLAECRTLGGCRCGEAKLTGGYQLPARHIIHTVGPRWRGGKHGEEALLTECYRNSLALASKEGFESIAFPLISSGIFGYPKEAAFQVAVRTITEFLESHEMMVYLIVFDHLSFGVSRKFFADVEAYVDDHYVGDLEEQFSRRREQQFSHLREMEEWASHIREQQICAAPPDDSDRKLAFLDRMAHAAPPKLEDMVKELDESFSEMLLRKIDEEGLTDAQCYKRANIDRRLFSKIKKDRLYQPSKATAVAFAVALHLSLPETEEFLKKAGFALSHSRKFDVIVECFIKYGHYDVMEINEYLFEADQMLLGG